MVSLGLGEWLDWRGTYLSPPDRRRGIAEWPWNKAPASYTLITIRLMNELDGTSMDG